MASIPSPSPVNAAERPKITLDLGDGVHSAPTLDGVYGVLLDLAKKFKLAHETATQSEAHQSMLATRLKFGAAMVQLRGQIPHGRWMQLCGEIAHRVGISTHTIRRAVKIAALADERGNLDPAKVAKAREVLEQIRNRQSSNCARARNLGRDAGSGEPDSNLARARNLEEGGREGFGGGCGGGGGGGAGLGEEEYETEGGSNLARARNLTDFSQRDLEALSSAFSMDPDELDFDEPGPIVVEEDPGSAGVLMKIDGRGAAGEQLTFASLVSECKSVVDRVVESAAGADPAAARELAASLRNAADRIDPDLAAVPHPRAHEIGTEGMAAGVERDFTDEAEATD